jgi:hypothetical protein
MCLGGQNTWLGVETCSGGSEGGAGDMAAGCRAGGGRYNLKTKEN